MPNAYFPFDSSLRAKIDSPVTFHPRVFRTRGYGCDFSLLSASLSLRLDFFFRSPIGKLKRDTNFSLSLFARSLRARPSSSRPRRSSRQERITAAQKRPILATFFLPSRKYTRTKTRQKCAEFVTPESRREGQDEEEKKEGKKLVQKRKENEATKDEKKKTDEGN